MYIIHEGIVYNLRTLITVRQHLYDGRPALLLEYPNRVATLLCVNTVQCDTLFKNIRALMDYKS